MISSARVARWCGLRGPHALVAPDESWLALPMDCSCRGPKQRLRTPPSTALSPLTPCRHFAYRLGRCATDSILCQPLHSWRRPTDDFMRISRSPISWYSESPLKIPRDLAVWLHLPTTTENAVKTRRIGCGKVEIGAGKAGPFLRRTGICVEQVGNRQAGAQHRTMTAIKKKEPAGG